MRFTNYSNFKDDFKKFMDLAKKGEDVIVTEKGKPILSLAGISKEEAEDFILAKHFRLEKKSRKLEAGNTKFYSTKEIKKHLGL